MHKPLKIIFCFMWLSLSLSAQHAANIASLQQELKQQVHDTIRVKLTAKLANEYLNQGNARLSVEYIKGAIELAKKIGYKQKLASLYNHLANSYVSLSDYQKGIENHFISLKISEERNNKSGIAVSYNNIAIVYYNLADFPKALDYLQKCLKIQEELGDTYKIAAAIGNIAEIYSELHEDSLSFLYQEKSFKMHKEMGNRSDMVASLNNLGKIYKRKQEFSKALDYHTKALKIASELDEKEGMKHTLSNIGATYLDMNEPEQALKMFFKATAYSDVNTDIKDISAIYINMASAYKKLNNTTDAVLYLEKAMNLSKTTGNLKEQKDAAEGLYEIYKTKNDFKKALAFHELSKTIHDSIVNVSKNESLNSLKTQFALDRQELDLKSKADAAIQKEEKAKAQQQTITYITITVLVLVLFFSYLLFKRFRITKAQNTIIASQKVLVEHKNKEITDSILYTKRLQQAIIPPIDMVKQHFPESFIYFKPKDIVAGDFYWMQHVNDHTYFAVADCTGHGVPGAMVSIVCSNALNGALKEFGLSDPGLILDKTRELVIETFEKSGEEIKDGMDVSLIKVQTHATANGKVKLQWSGANNSLWYISLSPLEGGARRAGDVVLSELKADKQPVGKTDQLKPFTTHAIEVEKGTCVYLFTDGFADQFGGPKGKKLKFKLLNDHLLKINHLSMQEQFASLDRLFMDWKGDLEQVDDVTIIGIRL